MTKNLNTFYSTTNDVKVAVSPEYLENHSDPDSSQFVWAYHVEIENASQDTIQILSRHWRITDSNGNSQEIVGDGLVGQKPTLRPGETFDYSSGTPLTTSSGFMSGTFHAISEKSGRFEITVPAFALDDPLGAKKLH